MQMTLKRRKKEEVESSLKTLKKCVMLVIPGSNKLIEFFQLWPLEQWITSLVGLVLMYWIATKWYNKRLGNYELMMSYSFRVWMIISDLVINLVLGLYYIDYRETIVGHLMVKCPIAVSPVIFIIELIIVILIKEYEIFIRNNQKNL